MMKPARLSASVREVPVSEADLRPHLSLVIPAFDEEARIGRTLEAVTTFLAEKPYRSEVLFVLDGCTDGTALAVRRTLGVHGSCTVRMLEFAENRGKGACVRDGMLAATGAYRFFTDADLSYPLHQLDTFLDVLERDGGIAIASRDDSRVRYDSLIRRVVTFTSRQVMSRLFVPGVQDTQAGFKGFTAAAAQAVFSRQRLTGWGFDAEILHIAHLRGERIQPIAVEWEDVPGSKLRLGRDLAKMGAELGTIVFNRMAGRYDRDE